VALIFFAGAADRVFLTVGVPYTWQIWMYRVGVFVVPVVVYVLTKRICDELRVNELHPFRGLTGAVLERTADGGFREERRRPG
jgi:ubiquinol-cytochrome c reductase cytochrome b subunit